MDFKGLALHLLQSIPSILHEWLPGGRVVGSEYCCSDISGGNGDSLKVNIKTGRWAEFAGDERGGDLISLYAAINHVKPAQAYIALCKDYNYQPISDNSKFRHFRHGEPSHVWDYHDADGTIIMHVARYETPQGKQFCPFTYKSGVLQFQSIPNDRPLYRLNHIMEDQVRPIIVVEGEKAADALQSIVKHRYQVTTWSGGSRAHEKTDWKPLRNRDVILWPDADDAGRLAMHHIHGAIKRTAKSVKCLLTKDLPEKYDAADFEGEWPELEYFLSERIPVEKPKSEITVTTPDDDSINIPGSVQDAWRDLSITTNRSGAPVCNIDTVLRVLEGCLCFKNNIWYDEFLDRILYRQNGIIKPWSDTNDYLMAAQLQRHLLLSGVTDTMVFKAVSTYAMQNVKNIIKDYLDSLSWNHKPRISTFFQDICGSKDSEYARAVSRNFILSMVARAYNPGCKADCMPILECSQGVKKSTMLSVLAGQEFYASASSNVHHVDFFQCLKGKWLIEFAELHQFSKADITKIKDIMSTPIDTYRSSYGRTPGDHPRRSVFAGTTNEETYLSDNTGARRFWPIDVSRVDIPLLRDTRDQIFAEAVHIYKSETPQLDELRQKSQWWIMPAMAHDEQECRRIRDPWEDDISIFLEKKSSDCLSRGYINENNISTTTHEIMSDCLKIEVSKKSRFDEMRIGSILKILGFKRKRVRIEQKLAWEYYKELLSTNQPSNSENVPDF